MHMDVPVSGLLVEGGVIDHGQDFPCGGLHVFVTVGAYGLNVPLQRVLVLGGRVLRELLKCGEALGA